MVRILITDQTKDDLKSIKNYIQKDSYQNSIKVVQTILEKLQLLEKHAEIGKIIAHTSAGPLRQILVYRYRIIYRMQNNVLKFLQFIIALYCCQIIQALENILKIKINLC
jgi:toxin ParE1/3/4